MRWLETFAFCAWYLLLSILHHDQLDEILQECDEDARCRCTLCGSRYRWDTAYNALCPSCTSDHGAPVMTWPSVTAVTLVVVCAPILLMEVLR